MTVVESAGNEIRSNHALPFWEAAPFTTTIFHDCNHNLWLLVSSL